MLAGKREGGHKNGKVHEQQKEGDNTWGINPMTKDIYTIITEPNCDRFMVEVWLGELKEMLVVQYGEDLKNIKTYIVMDNAPYNRAGLIDVVAEEPGPNLIGLPPYAPNLNLIERLWKFFKKEKIRNRFYETYDGFLEMIFGFFKNIKEENLDKLNSLTTLNFEIIKAF